MHTYLLNGVQPGDILPDILNGTQPGNFGWLTWTGDNGLPALVTSLTPPGDSHTYINPNDPLDHIVSIDVTCQQTLVSEYGLFPGGDGQ